MMTVSHFIIFIFRVSFESSFRRDEWTDVTPLAHVSDIPGSQKVVGMETGNKNTFQIQILYYKNHSLK
jgi:hypothetical protein